MNITELKNEGLAREFKITVPASTMQKAVSDRLLEMSQSLKLPGFRPGKVPAAVVKQRLGADALREAVNDAVNDSASKALTERNLRPAMQPKVDIGNYIEGQDLEFTLAVEILPEIVAADFSKLQLEKLIAPVADSEIDEQLQNLAKTLRKTDAVQRAAKMGDVLIIDFAGESEGKAHDGMSAQGRSLELGSKSFIDGFEEQLVGAKAGDSVTVKVTFPEQYHATELAGKPASFKVDVKEVREPQAQPIDDALATMLGMADLAELKKRITEQLDENHKSLSRQKLKRQLMDQLADMHDFVVPQGMVEAEFAGIWQQVQQAKQAGQLAADEASKSDDDLRADYHNIAERRVRLGLLLADVGQKQKITVGQDELTKALVEEARRFPGQEQAVFDYYSKNRQALEGLRAPLFEDKVVDYVLALATISEKKVTIEELMAEPEAETKPAKASKAKSKKSA